MRRQQIARLRLTYGLTFAQAALVASLHYGEARK
jgi:hypothetical protein